MRREKANTIDREELRLRLGYGSRRQFISRALAAGFALSAASAIADDAHAGAKNQRERRADMQWRYDYIVVGGGTAGCILADRLSEDGRYSVLLLERGGRDFRDDDIVEPLAWPSLLGSRFDYGADRLSTPQQGLNRRRLAINGGRVLGGSSSTNAMIWQVGDERDFRDWEERAGPRWGSDSMFRIARRIKIDPIKSSADQGLTQPYLDAHAEQGFRRIDVNASRRIDGVSILDTNIRRSRRFTPVQAYLFPALSRRNLTVVANVALERLDLNGGRCAGVHCTRDGRPMHVAAGEVVLTSGAVETPAILMRSGIGPRRTLQQAGVNTVVDSPQVGRNLKDHALLPGPVFEAASDLPPLQGQGISTVAYFNPRGARRSPSLQFLGTQFALGDFPNPARSCSVLPGLMKPRSQGRLSITGPSLSDPLSVNPNYLTRDADVEDVLQGFRIARHIGGSRALADFRLSEIFPGPTATSDAALVDFIRSSINTYFHYVSTCAMGRDERAVLDPKLRVRGVENLRVADASAIPEITASNTHVPTMLIAEKAAQIIRRDTRRASGIQQVASADFAEAVD